MKKKLPPTAERTAERTGERTAEIPAFDPIEAALREIFYGIENEPVPDDFADLVAKLGKTRSGEA